MAKKEETMLSEENKKRVTLIKYYMAEKGLDASKFDKAFEDAVNSAIEGMYKKYVPAPVRQLVLDFDISKSVKKGASSEEVSTDE